MNSRRFPLTPVRIALAVALCAVAIASAEAQSSSFREPPRSPVSPAVRDYRFGGRRYTAELAEDLRRQANSICLELDRNYRDNRNYRQVYRDAYQLIVDARHIQDLIREGYMRRATGRSDNDDHIARDLHDMDRLFHSVERDVRNWTPDRRSQYRPDRQTLNRLMMNYEHTLHDLMQDYGVRTRRNDDRVDRDRRDFPNRR